MKLHSMFLSVIPVTAVALGGGAAAVAAQMHGKGGGGGGMHGMMGVVPPSMPSEANPATPAKVELGRMLFYDPRLSKDGKVSCNSCHDLANYGVDGKPVSTGFGGQKGGRNSPTVYHAAGQALQFWDGRAPNVEEQAKGPVLNPVEMAMASGDEVVAALKAIPGYAPLFRRAFPGAAADPITFDHAALAIGAFERGLVTRGSRWDRFMKGERAALSEAEFQGHHEFMHSGCATCHNGPYVGGATLQKLGAKERWPAENDLGRIAVTKAETDRMVFKVPTLRNAAKTGPYFHDGQVASLDEAVRLMGKHQLGIELAPERVNRIVAWLNTLTGEIPRDYIKPPKLPR